MPFKKGQATPGAGRKGYTVEATQLERMRKLLNRYILLAEKDSLTPQQRDQFLRMEKLVLKTMDKLHASKSDIKIDVPKPILIK